MGLWKMVKEYFELTDQRSKAKSSPLPAEPARPVARPKVVVTVTRSPAPAIDEESRAQRVEDSIYLHSSRWDELLVSGPDGMPPLRLVPHNDRLWFREDTTGKLVKIANRKLTRLGIWSVSVRGWNYYPDAIAATSITPYEPVALVHEHENEFDKNAVAVHSAAGKIGYFNKQMAASLAKRLDAGEEVVAYITSQGTPPNVVAASPAIMEHLRRKA